MTVTKFRETYKDRAVSIPINKINLAEHCHIKAEQNKHKVSDLNREPMCVVRKIENTGANPEYALVIGYRDYITTTRSGVEEVKAIIVLDESRKKFLETLNNTPELCNTADIHEPKGWTSPNPQKISNCIRNFEATGTFGKGIVISPNGTILDGYAEVCAARVLGVEKIPAYMLSKCGESIHSEKWKKKNLKTP